MGAWRYHKYILPLALGYRGPHMPLWSTLCVGSSDHHISVCQAYDIDLDL